MGAAKDLRAIVAEFQAKGDFSKDALINLVVTAYMRGFTDAREVLRAILTELQGRDPERTVPESSEVLTQTEDVVPKGEYL